MTHNWKKDTQTYTWNIIGYCQFTQFKDLTILSLKSHSGWPEIHTDKHTHKSFPSDRTVSQRCCILSLPQVQWNNLWIWAHRAGLFLVWMQGNLQASLSISPDSGLIASEHRKHPRCGSTDKRAETNGGFSSDANESLLRGIFTASQCKDREKLPRREEKWSCLRELQCTAKSPEFDP